WYREGTCLKTWTSATQVLTADATAQMVRCGVNLVGFDQLQPFDGRLAAFVWSWAQNEPAASAGPCGFQGTDTRFHASGCDAVRHFACASADGTFHATVATGQ